MPPSVRKASIRRPLLPGLRRDYWNVASVQDAAFSRRHYLKVRGKTQAKANISNHAFSMSRMYSTCLDESQTFTHLEATRTLNWPLIRSRFEVAKAEYRPFIHIAFFSTNQPKFSRTFAPIRHGRSDACIQPSREAQRGPHGFRCGARR